MDDNDPILSWNRYATFDPKFFELTVSKQEYPAAKPYFALSYLEQCSAKSKKFC